MSKENKILIIDSTLRDGSHAMRHQFTDKQVSDYALGADNAGIELIVVGHGNGLGASSLQLGRSLLSDNEMLEIAKKNLKKTRLAAFLIPGFGTIHDDLEPAIDLGLTDIMIASHCTEANITRQHINYCAERKVGVFGVLMMIHRISAKDLLVQAKLMESYGAQGILLMDSAGAILPKEVKQKVSKLVSNLGIEVGFHAHNNLGMAIANSVIAVESGATIIDATSRGLGAGAGNCQLEVIVAVLQKLGYRIDLDLFKLMDNSENIIAPLMPKPQVISSVELTSGLAGIFSGFAPYAIKAAQNFEVDVLDIFIELGKRKIVAGQEDLIVDVAHYLKKHPISKESFNFHD